VKAYEVVYVTRTGKVLRDADIQALADEAERGYDFIKCPRCKMVSFNENDIREGYCGACHDFTRDECPECGRGDMLLGTCMWCGGSNE